MPPFRRLLLIRAYKFFDLAVVSAALVFSLAWSRSAFDMEAPLTSLLALQVTVADVLYVLLVLAAASAVFNTLALYESRRLSSRLRELRDVALAAALATVAALAISTLFGEPFRDLRFVGVFWATMTAALIGSRVILRVVLSRVRLHGRNLRHVLIVGTNAQALDFARYLKEHPELGYRIQGFVDHPSRAQSNLAHTGHEIVADFDEVPEYIRSHVVDEVFVFATVKAFYDEISRIITTCEQQGIIVRLRSDFFNLTIGNTRTESVLPLSKGEELVSVYTGRQQGWQMLVKRGLDALLAALGLVVLAPVLAAIALAIRLDSPGPILFTQDRVGLGKRRFKLYKFRTMIQDAEQQIAELEERNELEGPVFKIKDDPRITPLGRFLRKTSLDELPQLINVFKGDMSLVGPRPLPVRDYEGFSEDWTRRRFSVLPGITCLWQISGRNDIPFERWMELDMEYIDRWSLWLDLKILIKTLPAVVRGRGAS